MILSKEVEIGLNAISIKHFEFLGYSIPKYKDRDNKHRIKKGTKILVNVTDLPINSNVEILCKCDKCGEKRKIDFNQYSDFCFICSGKNKTGKNNPMYGKIKENSPNWNTNKSEEERLLERKYPEYKEWRKQVYERDKYTCQKCKLNSNKLNAHHLNNFAEFKEERILLENGVTLCKFCHDEFHKIYGKRHTINEMFKEFMINGL